MPLCADCWQDYWSESLPGLPLDANWNYSLGKGRYSSECIERHINDATTCERTAIPNCAGSTCTRVRIDDPHYSPERQRLVRTRRGGKRVMGSLPSLAVAIPLGCWSSGP